MRRPRRLRRVDIEARADAEIPRIGLARHVRAARARIRHHQREAVLRRALLRAALDRERLLGAREPREVEQRRHWPTSFRITALSALVYGASLLRRRT